MTHWVHHQDSSILLAIAADALAVFALIVLVVKLIDWARRLNRFLCRDFPKYNQYYTEKKLSMEIKYHGGKFTVKKDDYLTPLGRLEILMSKVSPKLTVRSTLITAYGLTQNEYSGVFTNVITLNDLFAEQSGYEVVSGPRTRGQSIDIARQFPGRNDPAVSCSDAENNPGAGHPGIKVNSPA